MDHDFEVLIRSFMRQDSLVRLVKSIRKYYPHVAISVVDDSPDPVQCKDCIIYRMPEDSGTAAGRNLLVSKAKAKYFVVCDDDFVFVEDTWLEDLQKILDDDPEIAIAGGRVLDMPGSHLRPGPARLRLGGKSIYVRFLPESEDIVECDYTSQFFMGRTEFFHNQNAQWDDRLVTNEHEKFFLDFPGKVVVTNKVRIEHWHTGSSEYHRYRNRVTLTPTLGLTVVYEGHIGVSVFVTVPNEGWIHNKVSECLLRLQLDSRYATRIRQPMQRPYENNLHHIVNAFCESDCAFWLNIDSDNPPMRNPLDLVELDKDIIGLPTPVWHYVGSPGERPIYWNAYDYDKPSGAYREHAEKTSLQRVDAIGTGCFLIARRVFDHPGMRQAPFRRTCHPDGTVHKGNDISFCERARARGFEIWAHYDYPCHHFCKTIDLAEVEQAMKRLWEGVDCG